MLTTLLSCCDVISRVNPEDNGVVVGTAFMMDIGPSTYRRFSIPNGLALAGDVNLTAHPAVPCYIQVNFQGKHEPRDAMHLKAAVQHSASQVRHALAGELDTRVGEDG